MGRVLGLDPGTRRIGVAVSDSAGTMAFPRPHLTVDGTEMQALAALVEEEWISEIVIGRPLSLKGTPTESTIRSDDFATLVSDTLQGVPVLRVDERLTTVTAQRKLADAGESVRSSRDRVDSAAAVILLETFLASRRA